MMRKLTKEQIKKLALSIVGFIFLVYVYFTFFLGPLQRSRADMLQKIADRQSKLDTAQEELHKAAKLEQNAKDATVRFTALRKINAEGAPLAWFPPRMKTFFANEQIDKVVARLEGSSESKQEELSGWMRYNWVIDLPQTDYTTLGRALADLENSDPLLMITRLSIHATPDQPQFQHVELGAANLIEKK
ncbi:MAG TPA: hypothetical protein VE758_00790 [Chthoniobacterales bacterium]|nr:hypothetical protein [Chthoniobacterales bacterium]